MKQADRTTALEILLHLGREITATLDPDRVAQVVVEAAGQLLSVNTVRLRLIDEAFATVRDHACYAAHPEFALPLPPLRLEDSFTGRILSTTKAPHTTADIQQEPSFMNKPWAERLGLHSFAGVPLTRGDRILGAILALRQRRDPFSPQEVDLLSLLAAQAAIAIENAQRYAEARTRAQDLETRVQERTRALEQASRYKSEFLSTMSHELRTPMNAVIGFAELLADKTFGELNQRQERYIHNILTSAQHLLHLINDILDLSKVEAGRTQVQAERFLSSDALRATLHIVQVQAVRKRISLSLEVAPDVGEVTTDPAKFKQIVYNLLSNAVKFTPEGGSVTVTARRVHGSEFRVHSGKEAGHEPSTMNHERPRDFLEVSVTDTGIGIPSDQFHRLFQPFSQLDSSLAREHQGTGLGLALTRQLVELQGGQIWAESGGTGQGSTFTVLLPSAPRTRPGPILVVDDEETILEAVGTALTHQGYTVETAASGARARGRLEMGWPALVILDLQMPEMSGWELLRWIRQQNAPMPILILSGVEATEAMRAVDMGAQEFLTKPFSARILVQTVEALLARTEPADRG
ncbi:MAG: response regulator [Candidatus Methylomirabilales bacterium]